MSEATTTAPVASLANAPAEAAAPAASTGWDDDAPAEQTDNPEGTTPAETKAERKAKRFLKAKVGGKEVSVDEETLVRDYQKYTSAQEKFEQASRMTKEVQGFVTALQQDPAGTIERMVKSGSMNPAQAKEMAEKVLFAQIAAELESADPRDQEVQAMKAKLAKYEEQEQVEAQTQEQQAHQAKVEQAREKLGGLFGEAMQATVLSKDPETSAAALREMALHYRVLKAQGETPDVAELVAHVENKSLKGYHSLAHSLEADELVSFLGDEIVNKIRKYDLNRLRGGNKAEAAPAVSQPNDTWPSRDRGEQPRKRIDPMSARIGVRRSLGLQK